MAKINCRYSAKPQAINQSKSELLNGYLDTTPQDLLGEMIHVVT